MKLICLWGRLLWLGIQVEGNLSLSTAYIIHWCYYYVFIYYYYYSVVICMYRVCICLACVWRSENSMVE